MTSSNPLSTDPYDSEDSQLSFQTASGPTLEIETELTNLSLDSELVLPTLHNSSDNTPTPPSSVFDTLETLPEIESTPTGPSPGYLESSTLQIIAEEFSSTIETTFPTERIQVNQRVTLTDPSIKVYFHHIFVRPTISYATNAPSVETTDDQAIVSVNPRLETKYQIIARRDIGPVTFPPWTGSPQAMLHSRPPLVIRGRDIYGPYQIIVQLSNQSNIDRSRTVHAPPQELRLSLIDQDTHLENTRPPFTQVTANYTARATFISPPDPIDEYNRWPVSNIAIPRIIRFSNPDTPSTTRINLAGLP